MSGAPQAPPGGEPLAQAASCSRAAAETLRRLGREDLADAIAAESRRGHSGLATVVVAGETKRGKSSLINALLGRPKLSPVDSDVATGAYLVFRGPQEGEAETATVHLVTGAASQPVDLAELAAWATVAGNPGNHKGVRYLDVVLSAPILAALSLVDTPGVSGLDQGHAQLTLEALGKANALVFVIDAGGPLTLPELEFLRRASERIDTVIFVLTKTDLYRGWQSIARDDRALLRQHAPRFAAAPILAVSNTLAARAQAMGLADDPEFQSEAGIVALQESLIANVAQRAAFLEAANLTRLSYDSLITLERSLLLQAQVIAAGPAANVRAALEAEQARLRELQSDKAGWPRTIDIEMRKMELARTDEISRAISQIRGSYTRQADKSKEDALEALPDQVLAELEALSARLTEQMANGLVRVATTILGSIDEDSGVASKIREMSVAGLWAEGTLPFLDAKTTSAGDHLAAAQAFSSGTNLVHTVLGKGNLSPVGLALGLASAIITRKSAARQAKQAEFKAWMLEQTTSAQTFLTNRFAMAMIDDRATIEQLVRSRVEAREKDIAAALEAGKRAIAQDASSREQAKAGLDADLNTLRTLRSQVATVLSALRQPAPAGGVPPAAPAAQEAGRG